MKIFYSLCFASSSKGKISIEDVGIVRKVDVVT